MMMIKITNTGIELIRIGNENSEKIEYSTDNGKSWHIRYIRGEYREYENPKSWVWTTMTDYSNVLYMKMNKYNS
jgi:hypothetical protein